MMLPDTKTRRPYLLEICSAQESARLLKKLEAGRLGDILSVDELAAVIAFRADKRRRDWLGGRLAAKRALHAGLAADGANHALSEIEIFNHENGAPYVRLPGIPEYVERPLTITHTGTAQGSSLCAAAVAEPGHLVGIDYEIIEQRDASFLDLMAHATERDDTFYINPSEQTRLWTLKEAVSKVLGTGLQVGFWDIRFPARHSRRTLELHGAAHQSWTQLGKPIIQFESTLDKTHVLSTAYTTGDSHA